MFFFLWAVMIFCSSLWFYIIFSPTKINRNSAIILGEKAMSAQVSNLKKPIPHKFVFSFSHPLQLRIGKKGAGKHLMWRTGGGIAYNCNDLLYLFFLLWFLKPDCFCSFVSGDLGRNKSISINNPASHKSATKALFCYSQMTGWVACILSLWTWCRWRCESGLGLAGVDIHFFVAIPAVDSAAPMELAFALGGAAHAGRVIASTAAHDLTAVDSSRCPVAHAAASAHWSFNRTDGQIEQEQSPFQPI